MSSAPTTAEGKAWMLATLRELAEASMELVRDLQTEVRAAGGKVSADVAMQFSRAARAVRQSVALYGLVLEDALAQRAGTLRGGQARGEGAWSEAFESGALVREEAADEAKDFLPHLAPAEALDAFEREIDDWAGEHRYDALYATRSLRDATAEIFLMLGLTIPESFRHHDNLDRLAGEHALGEAQPWREAWQFLRERPRPHLALMQGFDPSSVPVRPARSRSLINFGEAP
jgi:hypothetical protein